MTDVQGIDKAAPLPPGTVGPDFELRSTPDQTVGSSDFRGQPVILAFYPADWSPVCGDQMALYNEILPEFKPATPSCWASRSTASGATSPSRTTASCTSRCWPTSSPKGAVARAYGVYRDAGRHERAGAVRDRRRRRRSAGATSRRSA